MAKKTYMKPSVKAICLQSTDSILLLAGSEQQERLKINYELEEEEWQVKDNPTSGLQW